jgi:signal transduction histidine kinase
MASVLCVLVFGGALFAFGSSVSTLKGDLANTAGWVTVALDGTPASHDAVQAANVVASHYLRYDIVVLIFDQKRRVDVFKQRRTDPAPVVEVAQRSMPLPGSVTTAPFAHLILGAATAFGLQSVRARVGGIDIIVRESDAAFTSAIAAYVPEFFGALVAAIVLGFLIARVVTQQALRPLVDVTSALERFAAGDLNPHPIAADRRHQLGERERANAAMRQFIADAGHQLRTPLTVVRGFIAVLRKGDLRTPEDRERILETMNRQSQIMGSLIEKLMLLERWADPSLATVPEAIDVARLVEDVVSPVAEANPERTVRVDARPGPLVKIDPSDLTHAINNLVDNALKYTRGTIDVRVRPSQASVAIEICDEGPGMSIEEQSHAFDRFYRGNRREVDGSGLGLAIVRAGP